MKRPAGRSSRTAHGVSLATIGRVVVLGFVVAVLWLTRFGTRWPSVYVMTGSSMEPAVSAAVYYLAWSPPGYLEREDLVLFRFVYEGEEFHVLRRVAALPGDTIAMVRGAAVVNGEPSPTPYRIVQPAASSSPLAIEGRLYDWGPWIVPGDSVVLLSDTRDMMGWPDSRFVGFVPRADVIARATRTLSGRRLR